MKIRKVLGAIVGVAQGVMGALAIVFAYVLYHNFFDVQTELEVLAEWMPLYLLLLLTFGFFSIISGGFLIHEWQGSR